LILILLTKSSDGENATWTGSTASPERPNEWADIDATTTLTYLTSLADRKSPLDGLELAEVFFAAFAVGGWLVSAFLPDDGE
jgi:hypothetical protein